MNVDIFLIHAFVYLAAGVLAVPIAKKLGLGSVLGYLLAGIIIGPFVLNIAGNQGDVLHFAELGVVLMLFLVGLELRPEVLWRLKVPAVFFGGSQIVLSTLVLCGMFYFLGLGSLRVSLALGLIISLSSTAIVLQILQEQGEFKTQLGQNAFAVLLMQDISVIPILTFLPFLASDAVMNDVVLSSHGLGDLLAGFHPVLRMLAVLFSVAAIVVFGKYGTRPVFDLVVKTRQREVFTASALLIVIAITLLMNMVGVSAALGAFIGGMVISGSEYRHEIEADIEPFKGLLMGLFFISVGASINFSILAEYPFTILSLVPAIILIKYMVIYAIANRGKVKVPDNHRFAMLLSQGGEFAFVLVTFAVTEQVIPGVLAEKVTLAVALTMLVSPIVIKVHSFVCYKLVKRTEKHEQKNDDIHQQGAVIIAGFGRFGQVVSRFLRANGHDTTILEHSPEQIEMVRRFGFDVHYGDANRLDLLKSAGADDATAIVVAIDDLDKSVHLVEICRQYFPHLEIYARAYDRSHVYRLMDAGANHVIRETFSASLELATQLLSDLCGSAHHAEMAARIFHKHDNEVMMSLKQVWGDDASYGVTLRQSSQDLEQLLKVETEEQPQEVSLDSSSL